VKNGDMVMQEEIGICYIGAYLRQISHNVMLLDELEKRINYDEISNFKPVIVGLPIYSISKASVYRVIAKLKKLLDGVLVCVGGVVPSYSGEKMLEENNEIDFAIKGEGELVFEQLAGKIEKHESFEGVAGLIYRVGKIVMVNEGRQFCPDLDRMPFAARDTLLKMKDKLKMQEKRAYITTIRGCNGRCTFCASSFLHAKIRIRCAKNVVDEIEDIHHNLGINIFVFTDGSFEDSIDGSAERMREIAAEIIRRNIKISYHVFFRADFYKIVDDELMSLLKKSGLCLVIVGIDSGNKRDLELYNKRATIEDNFKAIEFLRKHRVGYGLGFINFNPYSTFETLEENIDFLEKAGEAGIGTFLTNKLDIYYGTPIYKKAINDPQTVLIDDGQDYLFPDARILKLYYYLCRYIFLDDIKYGNPILAIIFYSYRFGEHLANRYNYAMEYNDHKMMAIIDEIHQDRYKYLFQASNLVAKWYRQLLLEVKTGENEKKPDEYYSAMLFSRELLKVVRNIKSHMNRLERYVNKRSRHDKNLLVIETTKKTEDNLQFLKRIFGRKKEKYYGK
jgi:Fe-S oxidoreductase